MSTPVPYAVPGADDLRGPVLVPLDGSPEAERALPWGVQQAARRRAPLLLVRAVGYPYAVAPGPDDAELSERLLCAAREEAGAYLRDRAAALRQTAPGLALRTVARLGDPATVLLRAEREEGAQLVVMSIHGRSGLQRWVRGSVAEAVLRRGETPVLLVRSPAAARTARLAREGERVLVPLDGSDLAAAAVPEAARSVAPGAQLVLATVVPPRSASGGADPAAAGTGPVGVSAHALAQRRLEAVALGLRRRGLRATAVVLTAVDPAAALVDLATLEEVDLVVMATHGRGGWDRWRYGSVADAVSRTAPVPVLLVRPQVVGRAAVPAASVVRPAAWLAHSGQTGRLAPGEPEGVAR